MSKRIDSGFFDEAYHDDQIASEEDFGSTRFAPKFLTAIFIFVVSALGATLATNINLSTASNQEFGQGVVITTACDKSIVLTPISTYIQDGNNGFHRLTSVTLNGIDTTVNLGGSDEGCRGKTFKVNAYAETGTSTIAEFTLNVNSSGSIQSGDGNTIATGEGTATAQVTVSFEESTFASTNIYRFTIESKDENYVLTNLPNPFPGETLAALSSTNDGILYVITADTDGNGNCLTCKLYRSENFGVTWTFKSNLPDFLWHITGSADGVKLVGANWGGNVFTSNDSGATWIDRGNQDAWWHLNSSSSGQLIAGVTEKIGFKISRDFGLTWSSPLPPPFGTYIQSAISPDGTKIIVSDSNVLRYSDDGGINWMERPTRRNWSALAMSSDGKYIYAAEMKDVGQASGRIYVSKDYGLTWNGTSISNTWWGLKSSPNGKTVFAFAADKTDSIFISNDFGKTWRRSSTHLYTDSIAIKAEGEEMLILGAFELWGEPRLFRLSNSFSNQG